MKHSGNLFAAISALLASTLLAWYTSRSPEIMKGPTLEAGFSKVEQMSAIRDETGVMIACRDYQRIVCASTIAAEVLPHLISVDRIILVPGWFRENNPEAFRTQLRGVDGDERIGTLSSLSSVEAMLAAKPDLVIMNSLSGGGSERTERLRELGLTVLDLGPMLGTITLYTDIRQIGQVVGEAQRGADLSWQLERRLARVAQLGEEKKRKRAVYISSMGGSLIGGTEGSSYHDLLVLAGLTDAAAGKGYSPWPTYTPEMLLTLDPDLIITEHGQTSSLRSIPGVKRLRAATRPGGIVEMPEGTETVGLGLLPAVEYLYEFVHGVD